MAKEDELIHAEQMFRNAMATAVLGAVEGVPPSEIAARLDWPEFRVRVFLSSPIDWLRLDDVSAILYAGAGTFLDFGGPKP